MGSIRKIWNPELFQGSLKRHNYFEGWYFKLIDRPMSQALAVIPGVALAGGESGEPSHSFVQVISGDRTRYYPYPLNAFWADSRRFRVRVGPNEFWREGLRVHLDGPDGAVSGELAFSEVVPFPKSALWPGIMGPYSFVPGMECYHGIVNIRHSIAGQLSTDGQAIGLDGGTGYVEKDWGRSFPSCWIWLQANHFGGGEAFLFSVADIPWRGGSFRGFFAFLYLNGTLHRFATYTGARLSELREEGGVTHALICDRRHQLEVAARPGPGGMLRAPKNGLMDRLIEETIRAEVQVRLLEDGREVFSGTSPCAGMERYEHGRLLTK